MCVCLTLGIYEGEAETGPTDRARRQGAGQDNRHSEVDSSEASQVPIPPPQKISNYDTST